MAEVQVEDLCKVYPGAKEPAVHDISFTVRDGEFMVLLGPSGCGKSTALRMIAGLEPITSGTISIDGQVVNEVPAKARDIAMVFQSYALYPHMTVRDNMAFGLRRRRVDAGEIDRRVRAAAEKLGLEEFLQRKPHALSGGQRQRVALGRAIVRDPKVFLFDEPLSNLDAALRVSTRNQLIRQQREIGTTSIYVTHDQVEAMTMGDRICIMNQGRVVQIGRPLEVYRRPADTFVARFLGNPSMNLLPARVAMRAGGHCATVAEVPIDLPGDRVPGVADLAGRDVVLGVRPEDVYEDPPAAVAPRVAPVPVRVLSVEPLGAETLVEMTLAGSEIGLTARIGRETAMRPGDTVTVSVDTGMVHLFDNAEGKAIL